MSRKGRVTAAAVALAAWLVGTVATAQAPADQLTNEGVARASAKVDSVFIDRLIPEVVIGGGDFGSYLIARLGVIPIPDDLKLRVAVDTQKILIHGRVADLPELARQTLGPLIGMVPLQTPIAGEVELSRVADEIIRFRLAAVRVNGIPLPEGLVAAVMYEVGRQYPVLGKSGRDLYVRIPADGEVNLVPGGVMLRILGSQRQKAPVRPGGRHHGDRY
ncbi:hypothetical protein HRbin33_02239 [bacterium HR33]|nr:hypothetical protein HRbin33_02239 [bacterium HR33]